MPQTWKLLACPSLASQIQGLHTGPPKCHADTPHPDSQSLGDLLAPGASASPCWLRPAKAPSSYSYLGFSFCESPNPFCGEGGGSSCQAARQTAVWAPFLPLHQRGVRKGLSPVTPLSPVFWNRTWRTTRMEPRPLQSRMGESAPGQGQVGTHPVLLAPGFWLPSPGPCSVVHLTSLSSLHPVLKRPPHGAPVLHTMLVPASPAHLHQALYPAETPGLVWPLSSHR